LAAATSDVAAVTHDRCVPCAHSAVLLWRGAVHDVRLSDEAAVEKDEWASQAALVAAVSPAPVTAGKWGSLRALLTQRAAVG
jgi:hypothetical protein